MSALRFIPKEFKTSQMFLAAVKKDGLTLQYVPLVVKNGEGGAEMCLAAVKQNPNAIQFVPNALKTQEMCDLVFSTFKEDDQEEDAQSDISC